MKPIYYFLILCISFHLFGCGGPVNNMKLENTPESVAVNFVEALIEVTSKKPGLWN